MKSDIARATQLLDWLTHEKKTLEALIANLKGDYENPYFGRLNDLEMHIDRLGGFVADYIKWTREDGLDDQRLKPELSDFWPVPQ